VSDKLGGRFEKKGMWIDFFDRTYHISPAGVFDENGNYPYFGVCVILLKYVLERPMKISFPELSNWISYRDFKGSSPFAGAFSVNTENKIAGEFSSNIKTLEKACKTLGAKKPDLQLNYDIAAQFLALPKIPLLFLFNDQDEDFEAKCSILFKDNANMYLDMECLAMTGWVLSEKLIENKKNIKN
jgi:hypothetical protein